MQKAKCKQDRNKYFVFSGHSVNMEVNDSAMNGEPGRSNTSTSMVVTDSTSTNPNPENNASTPSSDKMLYGVDECPPWYLCAFLGLQVGSFKCEIRSVIPNKNSMLLLLRFATDRNECKIRRWKNGYPTHYVSLYWAHVSTVNNFYCPRGSDVCHYVYCRIIQQNMRPSGRQIALILPYLPYHEICPVLLPTLVVFVWD